MSLAEEGALWRQRFFEAQVGMERYLIETYGQEAIATWIPVRALILSQLDASSPALDDVKAWQERFFRTQALLEKYLVEHHGLEDLQRWTDAIGQVFRQVEPDRGGGAADVAIRFAKQAHLYGSQYEITRLGRNHAEVRLDHCAIWDYREQARRRGVQLTLSSPCIYCTKATLSNMAAKGFAAEFELMERGDEHGCRWTITRS
jgi:hypothetical protein